ncbi:MAG: DNA mismatch repair protein MutS [Oscillospiraceae bacterium]|nr:DNA mismatch repair protein MutS [Oscillospiraceae bacterium]
MAELSPMMKQYFEMKKKSKDAILFFRLGDFYEMFYEDAKIASRELELTLTGRDCGQEGRAPMCGIPYHSCEAYIARLIKKGYKIAICDQMGEATSQKGLVTREITRVITPGTVVESSMLDENKNNFISSLFSEGKKAGICFCDVSTGELYVTEFSSEDIEQYLKNEFARFSPREILLCGDAINLKGLHKFIREKISCTVEVINESIELKLGEAMIADHFHKDLEELGIKGKKEIIFCLGNLISYLKETQKNGLERINILDIYSDAQFVKLDLNTRRNLELLETIRSREKKGSLLGVLDYTKTAMGKRLIRTWIEQPLLSCAKISSRQEAQEELFNDIMLLDNITEKLMDIHDIERLLTRIVYGSAGARELRALCYAVSKLPEIKNDLSAVKSFLLGQICRNLDSLDDIKNLIESAIVEEPPISVKDGNIIKQGYNNEVDLLRGDISNGKGLIAKIEAEERKKTGISKLKVGYNRVYGYYIEITNSYKKMVPGDYIRKQTLTNCERYITQELKNLENRILGSRERSVELEYQLFGKVRETVAAQLGRIQKTAKMIAQLDVIASLTRAAVKNNYVKPQVNNSGKIVLRDSRHPVVEKLLVDTNFVPNDVILNLEDNRVAIITGPNMAGKSTYMRQTAIIVLMAQIGSFVPAKSAEIGVVDSIFTRVGASDDLSSGQSTFMVEMMEMAHIINNATRKSLLILDEIGRGTSTFDGMSIARAVLEYVSNKEKLGAKTLFSTHYHELTVLEDLLDGVKNYSIAVKNNEGKVNFLRKITPGGADDSYGIEVAKLAGLPIWVIMRAREILKELESSENMDGKSIKNCFISNSKRKMEENFIIEYALNNKNFNFEKSSNATFFTDAKGEQVIAKLKSVDVNSLTPIESLNVLFELSKMI